MIVSNNEIRIKLQIPLICLLCIIYGSFIPFHIRSFSFIDAITQFKHIPFLSLGIVSRADWVANILLYVPLGFSLTGWASKKSNSCFKNGYIFFVIFLFCAASATLIEFFQIFFSPRTVSLNDLIAEIMGSLAGILLWSFAGTKIINLFNLFKNNKRPESIFNTLFHTYLFFLLGFSLFPFDFLVSVQEIKWKYEAWKIQSISSNFSSITFFVKLLAEMAFFSPLGIFVGIKFRQLNLKKRITLAVFYGFSSALIIEFLQFFVASGMSQFFSVFIKTLGAIFGMFMAKAIFMRELKWVKPLIKYVIIFIFPFYVLFALKLSGWFKSGWVNIGDGFSKFDFHMLLPFYFHYFSTETRSVLSIIMNLGIYLPVGLFGWLFYLCEKYNKRVSVAVAIFFSMILSLFIESGKLFQKGLHPDFTNIIIAAASVYIVFNLSERIFVVIDKVVNE